MALHFTTTKRQGKGAESFTRAFMRSKRPIMTRLYRAVFWFLGMCPTDVAYHPRYKVTFFDMPSTKK